MGIPKKLVYQNAVFVRHLRMKTRGERFDQPSSTSPVWGASPKLEPPRCNKCAHWLSLVRSFISGRNAGGDQTGHRETTFKVKKGYVHPENRGWSANVARQSPRVVTSHTCHPFRTATKKKGRRSVRVGESAGTEGKIYPPGVNLNAFSLCNDYCCP